MTLDGLFRSGQAQLEEAGVADAGLDAWYLLEYIFHIDRAHFFLERYEAAADADRAALYRELVRRRASGIPLQYITGKAYFMGLEFEVNESVLIPRQDTETLVETALKLLEGRSASAVLDMCTGSGCIIISLARMTELSRAVGADISAEAVKTALRNARKLAPGRADFVISDMFENIDGRYDMIVSNPPYIRAGDIPHLMREVRCNEPGLALDGGADGLDFYRVLSAESGRFLNDGGWLVMETGYDQAEDVTELMRRAGLRAITVIKDLSGNDRVAAGQKISDCAAGA